MNKNTIFLIISLWLGVACSSENPAIEEPAPNEVVPRNLNGYVQKGPFINGTSISISELDTNLNQTGKSYSAQILDNKGTFELNNIEFVSNYVELKANGFYFNEVANQPSEAQLTLFALSDISEVTTLNVNVLSYLEKGRIQYLVGRGDSFAQAKKQAQQEVLAIFSIAKEDMVESELLNITSEGEDNAILLAISVILQGHLSVAELSELLANISTDIREDGMLDSETIKTELVNSAKKLNLTNIRENIQNRYAELGFSLSVSNYESYVVEFLNSAGVEPDKKIEYPNTGAYGINILSSNNKIFPSGNYSMKAVLLDETNIKIKIMGQNWYFPAFQENTGWTFSEWDYSDNSRIFTNTRTGEIDFNIQIGENTMEYPTKLAVYEDGSSEVSWTKVLSGTGGAGVGFTIPTIGVYGANIFAMADSSALLVDTTYSLAVSLPNDQDYDIEIKLHFDDGTVAVDMERNKNWVIYESPGELRLTLAGRNMDADIPFSVKGTGYLSIENSIRIYGFYW